MTLCTGATSPWLSLTGFIEVAVKVNFLFLINHAKPVNISQCFVNFDLPPITSEMIHQTMLNGGNKSCWWVLAQKSELSVKHKKRSLHFVMEFFWANNTK